MERLIGLLGIVVLLAIAVLFSSNRRWIRPRIVIPAFLLQAGFAVLVIGVVISASMYFRAEEMRTRAERETRRAEQAIGFMMDALESLDRRTLLSAAPDAPPAPLFGDQTPGADGGGATTDAGGAQAHAPHSTVNGLTMGEWTGEARWDEAARESATAFRQRRGDDGLWRQDDDFRGLPVFHGVAGNTLALLRFEWDDAVAKESAAVLSRHAFREDGLAKVNQGITSIAEVARVAV